MSLFIEKPPEGIIGTSTALILSPDFREVLLAPHKLKTLMPLGGKVEEKDSWRFEECLWREIGEEGGLSPSDLEPHDTHLHPLFFPSPVTQKYYHLKWKEALDTIYILRSKIRKEYSQGQEKKTVWKPIEEVVKNINYWLSIHRMYFKKISRILDSHSDFSDIR